MLGDVRNRKPGDATHRTLNGIAVSALRALTDLSLLVGSSVDSASIAAMISPAPTGEVGLFLRQHLRADMRSLERALGRNLDECCIFMHLLLRQMLTSHCPGIDIKEHRYSLFILYLFFN